MASIYPFIKKLATTQIPVDIQSLLKDINTTTLIDVASIDAGGSAVSSSIDVSGYRKATLTVKITYGDTATDGITVNLYTSPDGTNFDTVAYFTFDPNFSAGATVQQTKLVDGLLAKYIKVEVVNKDGANGQGSCNVKINLPTGFE